MKALLIAVVLLGSGGAPSVAAAAATPPGDRQARCDGEWRALAAAAVRRTAGYQSFVSRCLADCPARVTGESGGAYGLRAHDYCEVRSTTVLSAHVTGGQTHDEFIDTCLHRCVAARAAMAGAPLGWILGGVGAAALAGGVAAAYGGGGSHAPPASP